jgi:hypothetical protein
LHCPEKSVAKGSSGERADVPVRTSKEGKPMTAEEFSPLEIRRADILADPRCMFVLWLVRKAVVETIEDLRSKIGSDFPAKDVVHQLIETGNLLDREGRLVLTAEGAGLVGLLHDTKGGQSRVPDIRSMLDDTRNKTRKARKRNNPKNGVNQTSRESLKAHTDALKGGRHMTGIGAVLKHESARRLGESPIIVLHDVAYQDLCAIGAKFPAYKWIAPGTLATPGRRAIPDCEGRSCQGARCQNPCMCDPATDRCVKIPILLAGA